MRVETHVLGELQENAYLVFAQATTPAGEAALPGRATTGAGEAALPGKATTGAGEDAVFAQATTPAGEAGSVVAIDPGDEPGRLIERLEQTGARLVAILLTHGHWDHVGGVRQLKAAFDAPVYLHEADASLYARVVEQAALFGFHAERQPPLDHTVKHGDILAFGPLRFEVIHTPGHSPGGVCYKLGDVVFVGDTIFAGSVGRCDLPGGSFEQLISGIRQNILTLDDATVLYPGHGASTTVAAERATNPFLA